MVQIEKDTAQAILDYMWKDELINFCESFNVAMQVGEPTLEDCQLWIKWCNDYSNKNAIRHIFYSLLKLQEAIFLEDKMIESIARMTTIFTDGVMRQNGLELGDDVMKLMKEALVSDLKTKDSINKAHIAWTEILHL